MSKDSLLTWGLALSLAGTVFTAGGAWVRIESAEARLEAAELRIAKLTEVDHETALRLVKFDATLENLARATEELSREVRGLRGTRLARDAR